MAKNLRVFTYSSVFVVFVWALLALMVIGAELKANTCLLGHDWVAVPAWYHEYEYYDGKIYVDRVCLKCEKIDLSYTNNRERIKQAKEKERDEVIRRRDKAREIFYERMGETP